MKGDQGKRPTLKQQEDEPRGLAIIVQVDHPLNDLVREFDMATYKFRVNPFISTQ